MIEVVIAIGATIGLCTASALVPIINGELVLVGAILARPSLLIPLVIAAAFGQMIGKCIMYGAGAGAVELAAKKKKEALTKYIDKYREKFESHPRRAAVLVFVSASVGLPPFYVVSILAGAFNFGFWRFAALGFLGRLIRFSVIAAGPTVVHAIW